MAIIDTNIFDVKEKPITRIVLFEKCRQPDFEKNGLKFWHDKFEKIIRIDDENGYLDIGLYLNFKTTSFLEAGYVYSP